MPRPGTSSKLLVRVPSKWMPILQTTADLRGITVERLAMDAATQLADQWARTPPRRQAYLARKVRWLSRMAHKPRPDPLAMRTRAPSRREALRISIGAGILATAGKLSARRR